MNTSDDGSPGIAEEEAIEIVRSLPHGNVAAVLGSARRVGLDKLLSSRPCREQDLVMAMVVDRIISPGSKLSGSNGLQSENAQNTLADELGLGGVDSKEMAAEQVVQAYKSLSRVERAFRSLKTVDLHLRPIDHFRRVPGASKTLPQAPARHSPTAV